MTCSSVELNEMYGIEQYQSWCTWFANENTNKTEECLEFTGN